MNALRLSLFLFFAWFSSSFAQTVLNGDFEINRSKFEIMNMNNAQCDSIIPYMHSFGSWGNVDLLSNTKGKPQNGNWYIAITGGGTDRISLELSEPLVKGEKYSISFFDRGHADHKSYPLRLGLSESLDDKGRVILTTEPASAGAWQERSIVFTAPFEAKYVTLNMKGGDYWEWTQIDNVSLVKSHFKDRLIKREKEITVTNREIEIQLLDSIQFDGDIISLSHNDVTLLNEHLLTNKPKKVMITLNDHRNDIVLYANNLGSIPPNTATIRIIDGDKTFYYLLSSDLKSCGALSLKYKPE